MSQYTVSEKNITNLSCYNFDKRESILGDRLLNGSPTVCKPVRPMISDPLSVLSVSLSVLSVTLVYCGQTVEQIKMKPGMQVDLDHNALDGDPVPPERGTPHFRPMSVAAKWLNGLKCHLVWRYASAQATLCYMGTASPQFSAMSIVTKRLDASGTTYWCEGRPRPRRHCVGCRPSSP